MAILLPMRPKKPVDKVKAVKDYFEATYRVVFKKPLTAEQVEYLYSQMTMLPRCLESEKERLGKKLRWKEDSSTPAS